MFPLENLPRDQHLIDPDEHYRAFDKTFIPEIPCPQPEVIGMYNAASGRQYKVVTCTDGKCVDLFTGDGIDEFLPCVVKASHSDAGNGTFLIHSVGEYREAVQTIRHNEPLGNILVTKMVPNIKIDCTCHMYISKNGDLKFIGFNEQMIDNGYYKGGFIDMRPEEQHKLQTLLAPSMTQVKDKLLQIGYFGVCSVDILVDQAGDLYVIDINPRVGFGFIMASLMSLMTARGWTHALYPCEVTCQGQLSRLLVDLKGCTSGDILITGHMERPCNLSLVQTMVFSKSLPDCIKLAKKYFNFN